MVRQISPEGVPTSPPRLFRSVNKAWAWLRDEGVEFRNSSLSAALLREGPLVFMADTTFYEVSAIGDAVK